VPRDTRSKLPFVFVNFAMTADGKITTANRKVTSFSSRRDREHMFELRVEADAVMAGARTVNLNPVTLSPGGRNYRERRIRRGRSEYNLRVVVYMFMREPASETPALRHGALLWGGLAAATALTILLGLFPTALLEAAGHAAQALVPG
jgi:hypothetical protein